MGKVITVEQMATIAKMLRVENQRIILVGGCFDIIHAAHLEFLKKSKELGDKLIVILESDESIQNRKGENRPINNQDQRAAFLANLRIIDYVIPIDSFTSDENYFELVKKLKPDIIAITKDDPIKKIKEAQARLVHGAVVEVMERKKEHSTTKLIENLLKI